MLQGGGTFSRRIALIALIRFSGIARLPNKNGRGLGRCLCFWDGAEPSASEKEGDVGEEGGV